jgi:hypothetical protein
MQDKKSDYELWMRMHGIYDNRPTELYQRAQASDYSRKPARPVDIADIIAMFFTGVLFTLLCAIALGSL